MRRTASVRAQCYERAVKKWLVAAAAVVAIALAALLLLGNREQREANTTASDAVVENFRATERRCIAAFNTALRQQRANEIDELELAATVERDVLVPWRAMRARVTAAPVPGPHGELYEVMRRYVEERDVAWTAYVEALRAPSDHEARPSYDLYHQKHADAQRDAQVLGTMFRDIEN